MPFEYNKQEEDLILQNSIERVINSTKQILERVPNKELPEGLQELMDTNYQDWEELKELTVKLWDDKRNQIFIARQG